MTRHLFADHPRWWRRISLALILVTLSFAAISVARAEAVIISRAVLEDRDGRLSVHDIESAAFKPLGETLAAGYTDSAHWVRVQIRAARGEELVLRIKPTYLDEVRLFEPDPGRPGAWRSRVTGDTTGFDAGDRQIGYLGFVIRPLQNESTYYLRLKTTSTSLMNLSVISGIEARTTENRARLFQALYFAVMLFVAFAAATFYRRQHDPITAWFVVYQLSFLASSLAMSGYLAPFAPGGHGQFIDSLTSVLICVTTFLFVGLNRALLRLFDIPRAGLAILSAGMALPPLELLLMALGHTRLALQLNSSFIALYGVVLVVLAFAARGDVAPGRTIMRAYYCAQALIMVLSRFSLVLGAAADYNPWSPGPTFWFLVQGIVGSGLIYSMLILRDRHFRRAAVAYARARAVQGEQLAALNVELAHRIDQSEAAERAKTAFLARVSHELRTPLTHVVGSAQLLRAPDVTPDDKCEYLDMIDHATVRLRRSVEDIISLAEQSGPVSGRVTDLSPQDLVIAACGAQQEAASAKGLHLSWDVLTGVPPRVAGDASGIARALSCLVDNAVKFTERGSVRISAAVEQDSQVGDGLLLRFAVRDSGPGFDEADKDRLFAKFEQAEDFLTRSKGGLGAGLAIVRQTAKSMEGDAGARSEPGGGSTFWFTARVRPCVAGATTGTEDHGR